jgi:histidinol-phosphate aminotransferase
VYDSEANFILARRPGTDVRAIQQALKRQKILIRYFGVPGLEDCLRISIGTRTDMKTLIAALRRAVTHADRERAC